MSAMNHTGQLIFDIGAHKGEDTGFYLKKGFRVVAVEAHPALAEALRGRFAEQLASGQLTLVEAAIAEQAGHVDFFANTSVSVWGTIRKDWAERNETMGADSDCLRVASMTFPQLVREHGMPYYMKIDIEGADLLCLEGLREFSERPRHISIESEKRDWDALLHEFDLFQELGYTGFKVVDQGEVGNQIPPSPAREGVYVQHQFRKGDSGLFGEEAPGSWISQEQALELYRRIFVKYRLYGDYGTLRRNILIRLLKQVPLIGGNFRVSWYDTHATLG